LYRTNGLRAFYRGCVIGTIKVIPNACAVFVIYENTSSFLAVWRAKE